MGQIGINTYNGNFDIRQPQGQLSIKQIKAEMRVDQELPQVIIDQYQCFAEAGLKNTIDLTKANAQWAYQKWIEGIGRRCQEGEMLAAIERGNPIPDIAENNAYPIYDYNIDLMPKSRPSIDFTGYIDINWQLGGAEVNYQPQKPMIEYQRGKVDIYMEQWPNLEISYVDEKI